MLKLPKNDPKTIIKRPKNDLKRSNNEDDETIFWILFELFIFILDKDIAKLNKSKL